MLPSIHVVTYVNNKLSFIFNTYIDYLYSIIYIVG
jgi:hypothetical protein